MYLPQRWRERDGTESLAKKRVAEKTLFKMRHGFTLGVARTLHVVDRLTGYC